VVSAGTVTAPPGWPRRSVAFRSRLSVRRSDHPGREALTRAAHRVDDRGRRHALVRDDADTVNADSQRAPVLSGNRASRLRHRQLQRGRDLRPFGTSSARRTRDRQTGRSRRRRSFTRHCRLTLRYDTLSSEVRRQIARPVLRCRSTLTPPRDLFERGRKLAACARGRRRIATCRLAAPLESNATVAHPHRRRNPCVAAGRACAHSTQPLRLRITVARRRSGLGMTRRRRGQLDCDRGPVHAAIRPSRASPPRAPWWRRCLPAPTGPGPGPLHGPGAAALARILPWRARCRRSLVHRDHFGRPSTLQVTLAFGATNPSAVRW